MSIKDDIIAVLQGDVIPLLQDDIWADTYEVIEATETPDGAGGFTTVDTVIESGLCRRKVGTVRGQERVVADKLGFTSPVVLNLPQETLLTPAHTVTVNGRSLQVGEVQHGDGAFDYQTVAICQEIERT